MAFGPGDRQNDDFLLLSSSAVHLFWRRTILDEAVQELLLRGYKVLWLDASRWSSETDMHLDLARAFSFPSYYGKNLDALNDCLRDVAFGDQDPDPGNAIVLVLEHINAFAEKYPKAAHGLVDVFAYNSRQALLVGRRMLCLVQTDNARLELEPVGATAVAWNRREWLWKNRGIN